MENNDEAKKRGKRSRGKGYRGERELVLKLKELGIDVKRTAHAGNPGDLTISDGSKIEVKNRESIGNYLWEWQENVQYVAVTKNHKPYLIQMSLEQFAKLVKSVPNVSDVTFEERAIIDLIRKSNK